MKTYVIETIESRDCYFPYLHKYTIKANTIEAALQTLACHLVDFDFSDGVDEIEDELENEFGTQRDDEFYGCVYKNLLERCNCDDIIIRATCNGEKCFDLLIDDPIEIK